MRRCPGVLLLLFAAPVLAIPSWHQVPFPYLVRCAALDSDTTGWAAGTVGPNLTGMLRYEHGAWTVADTFRNKLIYDIAPVGDSAWAVGEQFNYPDGVVLRWDGAHWVQEDDPFDRTLQAVSFAGPGAGFAGGASPVRHMPAMLRPDGQWAIDTTLVTNRIILGMAATHPGKCYAVGDSGSIFRWNEGAWTQLRTLAPQALLRVALESNTEGWAVGDDGLILRCFKDTWAIAPSPTTRKLYGLAIAGTSGEAWAVGDSGTILHCERDSWHLEPFTPEPAHAPLFTVSFSSGDEGWAFGYTFTGTAVALHFYDDSTGIAEPEDTPPERARVRVEPSALRDHAKVELSLPVRADVELAIYDCRGVCVAALAAGTLAAGGHRFSWDATESPAGVYFCRLVCRGQRAAVRLTVVR